MAKNRLLDRREQNILLGLLGIGLLGGIVGAFSGGRFWFSFLQNAFFVLTLALGAALFVSYNAVSNAGWATVLRRVPEAMMGYVPIGGVSMLLIFFGRNTLYEWTNGPDPTHGAGLELGFKHAWLSTPFFFIRTILFLALWCCFIYLIRRSSLQQDLDGSPTHTNRRKVYSSIFLAVFAITFSLASFDWIMSLEPMFYSTIFAFYVIAGTLTSSVAAITILLILLRRRGVLNEAGNAQLHSLGKLVLGFSTFWAYIWISQYLLIYYANLPEETTYYYRRTSSNGWMALFLANLFLNWVIPFVMLLPRRVKANTSWMLAACGIVLLGHWLDIYVMVFPPFFSSPMVGWIDLVLPVGFVALFLSVFVRNIDSDRLVPYNDPYLEESMGQKTLEFLPD